MFKLLKWLKKLKDLISGYKTYIVCVTTIAGLLVAYSEGLISLVEFYQGVMAAIALITIRAGVTKSA